MRRAERALVPCRCRPVGRRGACRRAGACRRRGHRPEDGGAGLAADPDHAGSRQREVQGEVRQQCKARGRLHPLAGLLRAAGRLAHLGREEVPDGGLGQPVARRLRRGRLLHADRQVHQGRPGVAEGLQGPAPERGLGLLDLSLQVRQALRLPADAGRAGRRTIARTSSATRPSSRPTRPSTARSCPAPARRWTTSTGTRSRPSASSSSARRATIWPASRWPMISTASSTRRARTTTSAIMQVNGFIWQHGGDIWDETKAPKGKAEGVVNSPEAIKGVDHYLSLIQYMPPVAKTGTMGIFTDRRAVPRRQGRLRDRVDRLRREHDQPADLDRRRQGRLRPVAGPARRRRQARPLEQYRRPAFRADHLEQRRGDPGDRSSSASGGCPPTRRRSSPSAAARVR